MHPFTSRPPLPLSRRAWLTLTASALAAAASGARAAAAVKLEGFTFPGSLRLAETELQLNGTGLRAVAWLKGYAAALYLARKAASTAQVLATPGAKRLQMRMLIEVETEEFVKAVHKGFERNTPPGEQPALAERLVRFDKQLRAVAKVRKGDAIDLDWLPDRGLLIAVNGAARGEPIAGEDFYAALLRVFLGDKPVDAKLKAGLLGAAAV